MGKIKTNVTALKKAIEMTEIVLTDNMMSDAVRNLIFYIKDNKIHIIGRSSVTCCLVEVEGETDRADDSFESVNLKELQGILKAYNNMKRTIPTTIEFHNQEQNIAPAQSIGSGHERSARGLGYGYGWRSRRQDRRGQNERHSGFLVKHLKRWQGFHTYPNIF